MTLPGPNSSGMSSISYEPKDYWLREGRVYKDNFKYNKKFELQERSLVEYLADNIFRSIGKDNSRSTLSVLEVGCGFGRITKLITERFGKAIEKYIAVDLSPDQIKNARDYIGNPFIGDQLDGVPEKENGNGRLQFIVSDIQSLHSAGVGDQKYDLVLACEVLLHVLPSEIESVVNILVEMSDRHIVNVDWYEDKAPKNIAPHNFIHQYEKLYRSILSVKDVNRFPIVKQGLFSKVDTKQSIFHAIK